MVATTIPFETSPLAAWPLAVGGVNRTVPARFSQVVNVRDFGAVGDGITNDTAAIQKALAQIQSSTLDATYAVAGAKQLYFPAGWYVAPGLIISSLGTGFAVFGDGLQTQLDGISFDLDDDSISLCNFALIGSGSYGIHCSRSGRRGAFYYGLRVRDRNVGWLIEGGSGDQMDNCVFESNGVNLQILNNDGEINISNTVFRVAVTTLGVGDNIQIAPTGSNNVNALKFINCNATTAGRYNIYLYADNDNTLVECYFIGMTATGATARSLPITAITDNHDGTVRCACVGHLLLPRTRSVTVTATGYTASYSIVSTPDADHFDITAPFVTNVSGTMSVAGWDIYCDLGGNFNRVNDLFFIGGSINRLYLQGYNIVFWGSRLKDEIWIQATSNIAFAGSERGRNIPAYTSVPIGGTGSYQGWGRIGLNTGDVSFSAGNSFWEIIAPNPSSGLSGLLPAAYNKLTCGETGITITRNGLSIPDCIHSGGIGVTAAASGTDKIMSALDYFTVEIYVPETATFTGISLLNGTVTAGNIAISMYTADGNPVTTAQNITGVAQTGTSAYQKIPFSAAATLSGPAKYFAVIQSDNTGRIRTHTLGNFFAQKLSFSGAFGSFTAKTMPTTFVSGEGPICDLYV